MFEYIVGQIIQGNLDYNEIIELYPKKKKDIDELLIEKGYDQLIKK